MRCTQVTSGLLSIVGAAFLFGTVHALVVDPVDISPVALRTDGPARGKGARTPVPSVPAGASVGVEETDQTQPDQTPPERTQPDEAPPDQDRGEGGGVADESSSDASDAGHPLLDAPVPEGTLTLRQSYELWEQGAYFVDARHEHEFAAGHIQDAAWLPSTLFDTDAERAYAVVDSMPPDATVVIYCVGGECDASHNTARRLQQLGFTDLRIMGMGYSDWRDAGLPTEGGSEP